MQSDQWRDVDHASDPDYFVRYLAQAAQNLRESRLETLRKLEVTPGCSILDVGCGAGDLLIELAGTVNGVRAVGIDTSAAMIQAATSSAAKNRVDVHFALGDVERLEFSDATFDRIHCSRVLVHVESPETAIKEMARVLAPGGRVAIFEPDFDALMIDSNDLRIARSVRQALTASLQNPDIGRRLRRLVLSVGLEILDLSGLVTAIPSLQHTIDSFELLKYLNTAVTTGAVSADDADAWRIWLEAADAAHQFMVAAVAFRVLARK